MLIRGLILAAIILVLFSVYARLAPSDAARWHVDPEEAEDPGSGGVLMDATQSRVWSQSPEVVMQALAGVAPDRTVVLAGTPAEGHMTFISRSAVMGFPDYTTVKVVEGADGTRLMIFARLRFGKADVGVNRARTEAWLQRLTTVLPPR